ncbi:MAG: RICIN domain-containing protein, partial [Bacteroidaceae bacterium]|nr:RICIN domain-containing protein [Bacteroidaceae bacterium]
MNKFTRTILFFVLAMMALQIQAFETGQTIRIVNGGKSILVENSSLDENKKVVLWTETNVNSQRWTITAKTNGTFLVANDYTGFYLAGLTSSTSGNVGQTNKTTANTRGSWEFVPV